MDLLSDSSYLSDEEPQVIEPPRIKVVQLMRHSIEDSQTTIFECKAKQLSLKPTRARILPEALTIKHRSTKLSLSFSSTSKKPSLKTQTIPSAFGSRTSQGDLSLKLLEKRVTLRSRQLNRLTESRSNSFIKRTDAFPRKNSSKPSSIFSNFQLKPLDLGRHKPIDIERLKPNANFTLGTKTLLSQQNFSFDFLPNVSKFNIKPLKPSK